MSRAAGILTSRGGLASHAAVVARGWGIPAVVGAEGVEVGDGEIRIDGRALRVGDVITIDGGTGEVFEGIVAGTTEVVPEVATLVGWAREAGIDIGNDQRPSPTHPSAASGRSTPTAPCVRSRSRVSRCPEGIADADVATPDGVRAVVEASSPTAWSSRPRVHIKLTEAGHVRAEELLAAGA